MQCIASAEVLSYLEMSILWEKDGCINLILTVFHMNGGNISEYMETILSSAFSVIIAIEFIRMLVKHSTNTIVEVLIFEIARGLVMGDDEAAIQVFIKIRKGCRQRL